jgi:DNA polymerase III subunit epsilon
VTNLADVLRLARPLAVPDVETTGVVVGLDRIIQIGLTIHYPHREPIAWATYVDPEMPIPAETTQKFKISDADVAGAPTWRQIGPALAPKLRGVDFAGYNVDFDLKHLRAEFQRVGVDWDWEADGAKVVDAKMIFFQREPRDLTAAVKRYLGEDLEGAHDAGNDVRATERVLAAQLALYPDLPRTVDALAEVCFPKDPNWVDSKGKVVWRAGEACLGFGQHNGTPLRRMEPGYLRWMLGKDFPADTKKVISDALAGRYPRREA